MKWCHGPQWRNGLSEVESGQQFQMKWGHWLCQAESHWCLLSDMRKHMTNSNGWWSKENESVGTDYSFKKCRERKGEEDSGKLREREVCSYFYF